MFTKAPNPPGGPEDQAPKSGKAPAAPQKPPQKGGAPVDHKSAIAKMHPEHLHKLVQDAHAGKFGPEAQKTAQSAMQAPGAPGAPGEQPAAQQPAAPDYSGMFGGGGAGQAQDQDEAVPAGQMFGGR